MILSGDEILKRLNSGEIFRKGTWDEGSIKQASYALRVAPDGLMLGGRRYPRDKDFEGDAKIKPGEIAILSTKERLNMPGDLVGKLGIRFDYATQGLTGLMGIQVDPFFGWGHDEERLYMRVANLGNEPISIPSCADVFTFELHRVSGNVPTPTSPRKEMWYRLQEVLEEQDNSSWSNVTQVQMAIGHIEKRLESDIKGIRDYLQPLVMFGIFLVAVTILGVALSVILTVRDTPTTSVPTWVTDWGWWVLLGTLSFAAVMTGLMGAVTVALMFVRLLKGN